MRFAEMPRGSARLTKRATLPRRGVVRAAGVLALALALGAGQAVGATAAVDPPVYQPAVDTRSVCDVTVTPRGTPADRKAVLICSYIPAGVQVRVVIDAPQGRDVSSWGGVGEALTVDVPPYADVEEAWLEERADPALPGTDCTIRTVKQERSWLYDLHAAAVTCTTIAAGVKVRARADFTLQPDEVSGWLTGPGFAETDLKARTSADTPNAEIDYAVR